MSLSQETPRRIEIVPLTLHIGAEIRGVDLTKPLPPQQVKEVRDAFLKWKVVFFRNQHLDHAHHVAMARQFGEPTIGHAVLGHLDDYPEIYSVAKNRLANENRTAQMVTPWTGWHADITAAVNPPMASILRGVTIPPYGRRHVLDQPERRLYGALADLARLCRRAARDPPIRQSRRGRPQRRIQRPREATGARK